MTPQPNDGFAWAQAPAGPALICTGLERVAAHFFTTRAWALGSALDSGDPASWRQVADAIGVDPANLIRARQVHGATVVVRRRGLDPPQMTPGDLPEGDILVSDDARLALAVQSADCVPILIADRRTGAVAAAHAGWRGLAARVPAMAVEALTREFGSRAVDLIAAIGPSISAARYEVGEDVRRAFQASPCSPSQLARWFAPGDRPARWYFDGWQSARDLIEATGVPAAQIYAAQLCTASLPDLLCSYRRDGKRAGRVAGAIRPR